METFNVVFATDESYVQHVATALVSLLQNNKSINININYITDFISERNKIKLIKLAAEYSVNIDFFSIGELDLENASTGFHFNKAVYFRLAMADVLPFDKVLYLDADIVVNGNISKFFSIDLKDNYLAAVVNPGFTRNKNLYMRSDALYFNAGVFLANLKLWRLNDVKNKCLKFMQNHHNVIQLADQDVLNAVVNGKWLKISPQYNQQAVLFEPDFEKNYRCFSHAEFELAMKNPIIIHYSGSSKPWHFRNNHSAKELYWEYRRKTPFSSYLPDDLTFLNLLKFITPDIFKLFLKKFWKFKWPN